MKASNDDLESHFSCKPLAHRFKTFLDLVFGEKDTLKETIESMGAGGISMPRGWKNTMNLMVDLQHPLLKKYKFDPIEFSEGAKVCI